MVEGRRLRAWHEASFIVFIFLVVAVRPSFAAAPETSVPLSPAETAFVARYLKEGQGPRHVMRAPKSDCGYYLRALRAMGPIGEPTGDFSTDGQAETVAAVERLLADFAAAAARPGSADIELSPAEAEALGKELKADFSNSRWPEPIEIYAIGVPYTAKDGGIPVAEMRARLKEAGLDKIVTVRSVRRASSKGLRGVWEEFRLFAFPIRADDWERSTPQERRQGLQSWALSSGITLTLQSLFFGWAGLAGAVVNAGFSYNSTMNRAMWNNYYGKYSGHLLAWIRQFWMTEYYGAGVYWASIVLPALYTALTGQTSWEKVLSIFTLAGWLHFLVSKFPSTLLGASWRKPSETGLQEFIERESREGRGFEARTIAAKIRKFATLYGTNVWAISLILTHAQNNPAFEALQRFSGVNLSWLTEQTQQLPFVGWQFNIGHAGLAVLAAAFGLLALNPEWYRITEADFRSEKWRDFKTWLKEAPQNAWQSAGEAYTKSAPLMMP